MPDIRYPRLANRLQAALIDAVIFIALFFGLVMILANFHFYGGLKAALFALVFLILEPGLVCATGGTIGHHALGLKIQDKHTGGHLNPFYACVRFVLKYVVGWISFTFVLVTKQHQAVHDILSGSVVTIRNPIVNEGLVGQPEREIYLAEYKYPARSQRVLIILLYLVVTLSLLSVLLTYPLSDACMNQNKCTPTDGLIEVVGSLVNLAVMVGILFFGWTGRLFGAKRTPLAK